MTERPRLLLVDDEAQLVRLMSRYLERLGYDALFAATTQAGWTMIEEGPPFELAIIDVSLEDPSGEELAKRILSTAPQTTVVLTSGYAVDISPMETAYPRRVAFLQKPFSAEMLADVVRRVTDPQAHGAG